MNTPLSNYWTVEYHFNSNSFSVCPFPDYLSKAQAAFHQGRWFDSVILALHPTREGASEECAMWQERRNLSPLNVEARIDELRRYVRGLESQLER